MKLLVQLLVSCVLCTSCATQGDSLELGGVTGLLVGSASMAAAQGAEGGRVSLGKAATGAEVGALLGAVVSYLIHRSVEKARKLDQEEVPQMYFGDLPPSPFVVSKQKMGVSK